jgi:hypothetical protein
VCSSEAVDWKARAAVRREVDEAGLVGEAHVGSRVFVGRLRWSETPRRHQWKNRPLQIDEE